MRAVLGILGCTGVGKSAVAVSLAKRMGAEIISADSMQIYRGMDVGTAKITEEEMQGVRHRMLDVVDVNENYSAFDYSRDVNKILSDNPETNFVIAGGTGFYFDCLMKPLDDFNSNERSLEIRREMNVLKETQGVSAVLEVLKKVDPETYTLIDKNNLKRVIRAIEIADSGVKKSQGERADKPTLRCQLFVLSRKREVIVSNATKRVDLMFEKGLVKEVETLYEKYPDRNLQAFQAIGYKEIIAYLNGECSLPQAKEKIVTATRQYAKRQTTYFKHMQAQWVDLDTFDSVEQVATYICENSEI